MIYKRATKQLRDAGIEHIVIVKRLWGPSPEDTRARKQTSQCFGSWQQAVKAVLEGYRPEVHEQLVMPGAYWVETVGHRVWPDGARFLVVQDWHDDWLLCWRDGVRPQPERRLGTLLREGQVERV